MKNRDEEADRRIRVVVALADRREQYYVSRNKAGLLSLAEEYASRGMVEMAREVRLEADNL